ncbi:MAG TPA: ABC transporter substrate-binding protein [Methylomirabilota bacterium]|jgi:branched-chain amino acid transport system substrate-binding protein|nr:ABC transporter substrate-binding protein [Methylomirabilota bacterium]
MHTPSMSRRRFVKSAAIAAGVAAFPLPLRAQGKTVKVGVISPITGAMAEVGGDCRLGAQLAAEAINAAGGIKSLGGAKLELLLADSETKVEVARSEADRLIGAGAQLLTGGFHSAHVATVSSLAQQRRVPYMIDISGVDAITANIAKSVREGQQKIQYVYRNFPGLTTFGRNAVKYMTEVFREAKVSPKRVVVMYSNDLFGKNQSAGFEAAVKAMSPGFEIVEMIPYPETAADLSTEMARAKALKPDIIAPVTRPVTAILLLEELAKQRVDVMGVISPGAPGLYEPGQIKQLKELIEHVMDAAPWPNYKSPFTQKVAAEFAKRSNGRYFDASGAFAYEAVQVIGDVLERAASTDPDAIVGAIKKTNFGGGVTVSNGPVIFNELGDNPNASTALIQIINQKPRVVWPRDNAETAFVFPKPRK